MVRTSERQYVLAKLRRDIEAMSLIYLFTTFNLGRLRQRLLHDSGDAFTNERLRSMQRKRRRFRAILLASIEVLERVNAQHYLEQPLGRNLRRRRNDLFKYYLHLDNVRFKQFVSMIASACAIAILLPCPVPF